jgi:transposase
VIEGEELIVEQTPAQVWVGVDVGKVHHWFAAVDVDGHQVWSRKIVNDEADILAGIDAARGLASTVSWAVDMVGSSSALLLALLAAHGQASVYVPGRTVNTMTAGYRGEAKTDARDAFVIADTARLRHDFAPVAINASLIADLALLTGHRSDLVADRVRMINRLRDVLTGVFPALERAFDYSHHKGALVLLTGFQSPAALRRRGQTRLAAWLHKRGVRNADQVAATALAAAQAQHIELPGQAVAADIVADLARQILAVDERLRRLEQHIGEVYGQHPQADIITSLPGIGPILAAEFIVAAGDLTAYVDAGQLASAAGLVPVPRDSGRRTGNLHRPNRYNRRLRRALYLAARASIVRDGPNRDYYLKKRREGRRHTQALIALARRRVDVLWALLRDNRYFTPTAPATAAAA